MSIINYRQLLEDAKTQIAQREGHESFTALLEDQDEQKDREDFINEAGLIALISLGKGLSKIPPIEKTPITEDEIFEAAMRYMNRIGVVNYRRMAFTGFIDGAKWLNERTEP